MLPLSPFDSLGEKRQSVELERRRFSLDGEAEDLETVSTNTLSLDGRGGKSRPAEIAQDKSTLFAIYNSITGRWVAFSS